eukprot:Rhum_TRINITY_DN13950_c2_g2::Rhum_TRINITY_DN13950_c2_g2_i1::g.66278::m.66278
MAAVDTSFLKDELGPVLAKGIAETVCAAPQDPIEFLGLWLRHHLEEKEAEARERTVEEENKVLREEWNRSQAAREKAATEVIQNEWRAHQQIAAERQERETELRTRLEQFGEELDEEGLHNPDDIGFDNVSDPEAPDEMKEKEVEVLKMDVLLKRWRLYLKELSKENIADVKLRPTADDCVVKVMRCFFYALGKLPMSKVNGDKLDATPSRLASWRLVRANIKPHPFLTSLQSYDVAAAPKRSILRVRRILTSLQGSDDVIKEKGGQAVYLLFQWLWTTVEYRCARDELFKAKKEAGKDMPGMEGWEDDAGEPLEGEEQDEDEETQRKLDEEQDEDE